MRKRKTQRRRAPKRRRKTTKRKTTVSVRTGDNLSHVTFASVGLGSQVLKGITDNIKYYRRKCKCKVNVNLTSNTGSACAITRARGSWVKCLMSRTNWNLEMLVFEKRGKPEYRRKTSRSRERTNNKFNPHVTPGPRIEPWTHWWEASALATAPTLLPKNIKTIIDVEDKDNYRQDCRRSKHDSVGTSANICQSEKVTRQSSPKGNYRLVKYTIYLRL